MVIGIVIGALVLLVILILLFVSLKIRHNTLGIHYYDQKTLKYFTYQDFDSLSVKEDEIIFKKKPLKLFLYKKTNINEYNGIIIFAHGIGPGHLQYTTEINYLCSLGYKVLTYDCYGTGVSGGRHIKGYQMSLLCLNKVIEYYKNNEDLSSYPYIVCGHSMGGFAVCNITLFHNDMKGIIALAPFNTSYSLLYDAWVNQSAFPIKLFYYLFKFYDFVNFGKFGLIKSVESLKKATCPVLIIAGDHDIVANYDSNFLMFKETFKDNPNFKFITSIERGHRPLMTKDGVKYEEKTIEDYRQLLIDYGREIPLSVNRNYYANLDYLKLTEMDEAITKQIEQFCTSCLKK